MPDFSVFEDGVNAISNPRDEHYRLPLTARRLLQQVEEVCMKSRDSENQNKRTDNDHQKAVSGKKQHGPADKIGKDAGGAYGSRGQNRRSVSSAQDTASVGSHKPEGDGPGTKKFKHESDNVKRGTGRR